MRSFIPVFLFALILQGCKLEQSVLIESDNFEFVELADGVYSCIHKFGGKAICNVGVVDNGKETLIFDSFLSPKVAQELSDAISQIGLSPVKYVVNSHFHNDHIRGNQVFSEQVKIISTSATSKLITSEEPLQIAFEKENAPQRFDYYDSLYLAFTGDRKSREYHQILMWRPYYETLSNSHKEVNTRVPDMYVDSLLVIEGPDRDIQLISKGEGHTESDLILYLPDDNILFSGDLLFNECHPYVAHGNITKWKAWLDFMDNLGVTKVMPGHGQLGSAEVIGQMKEYLQDLETTAANLVKNNTGVESLDTISVPEQYKTWWFDRFYAYNLNFAYESALPVDAE